MAKPPERAELKPGCGCFSIVTDAGGGEKVISFQNTTRDSQFNINFTFAEPVGIQILSETKSNGEGTYATSVYPGETREFVKGKWRGYKRGFSFGPPDEAWAAKQAAVRNAAVEEEITAVKIALKQNPSPDGKYTAEYISKVCELAKVPFVDLTFPPKPSSISRDFEGAPPPYPWMRPFVYCTEPGKPPCLFVGEIEPNDIDQGQLGNCYFLCALACISEFPALVQYIFRNAQHPSLGIYRIALCKNAWLQTVVVDDLFPTSNGKPVFAKNREEPNELWVSIAEKAYAKLHGSYYAIRSGDPAQAVADLIGCPYQKLKDDPVWQNKDELFAFLLRCDLEEHIMVCGTPGSDTTNYAAGGGAAAGGKAAADSLAEQYKAVGLVTGHAFSLIRVKEYQGQKLCMLRNPWGNGLEWNGDWSDNSPRWTPQAKKDLDFVGGDDGTFWMPWPEVVKYFDGISVAYWLPAYSHVRVAANFEGGVCDCVPQLFVTNRPVKVYLGVHQKDNRGLATGDPDRQYAAVMGAVVLEESDTKASTVATSQKASFLPTRDHLIVVTLQPRDKPYYFMAQCHGEDNKSCTLSLFIEDNRNVRIHFVALRSDLAKRKFNPPSAFVPGMCNQKVAAKYQLLTPAMKGEYMELQGESVVWQPNSPSTTGTARAPAATAAGKAPPVAAKIEPVPEKMGGRAVDSRKIKLTVTVLSGRSLVAKDIGGSSDPYVTLTLLDKNGAPVPGVDEVSTRYINNTLTPTWGEVFVFQVAANDILSLHCWDKDLFGRDDMGSAKIRLADLSLKPGGPGHVGWFPLSGDDATGDINLMMCMTTT